MLEAEWKQQVEALWRAEFLIRPGVYQTHVRYVNLPPPPAERLGLVSISPLPTCRYQNQERQEVSDSSTPIAVFNL